MHRENRRKAAELVAQIDLSEPISPAALSEREGRQRGLTIRVVATALPPDHRGHFKRVGSEVTISYNEVDPPWTQEQTILHELIHAIAGHGRYQWFDGIDPARIDAVLSRRNAPVTSDPATSDEEEIAEYGALLLHERIAPRCYTTGAHDARAGNAFGRLAKLLRLT